MAWIPLRQSELLFYFYPDSDDTVLEEESVVRFNTESAGTSSGWSLEFDRPTAVRISANHLLTTGGHQGLIYNPARFWFYGDEETSVSNLAYPWPASNFPSDEPVGEFVPYTFAAGSDQNQWVYSVVYSDTRATSDDMSIELEHAFLIEVWTDEEIEEVEGFHVYELDRGWSFDGAYIPHYIEMNWYFGDDPIHYHSVQKIRIHGMSKGLAQLTVATNGMQTDYERDFSEPQVVDLPRSPKHISTELIPETNYTDSANRGLSIQMKFEGRNRDLTRPEPQHVLQVLAVQSSPAGTGSRSN